MQIFIIFIPEIIGTATAASSRPRRNSKPPPITIKPSVRVGLGLCAERLGQRPRAQAAFARALPLDPECVDDGAAPVHLAPQSYAFVLLPDAAAERCY